MKTFFYPIFSLFLFIHYSFADIHYYRIDTLNRGQGIDLDSNLLRTTGFLFGHPSPYQPGPNYDSAFNADFALSMVGLLWCFCDSNARLTFFDTYKSSVPLDSLVKMDSLVLTDSALFRKILPTQATFPSLIPDVPGLYIIESNQHRFSIFRIAKQLFWYVGICDPCPMYCFYCPLALAVEWWYQDDGSLNFKDATRIIQQDPYKRGFTSGSINTLHDLIGSGMRVELYNPSGRLVGYVEGKKAPDMHRLPSGILLYKMNVPDQPPVWGKVLVK